jgi:hypothetical protein
MEGYDRRWVLGTWEGHCRKPSGALIAFSEDSTQDFWEVQHDFQVSENLVGADENFFSPKVANWWRSLEERARARERGWPQSAGRAKRCTVVAKPSRASWFASAFASLYTRGLRTAFLSDSGVVMSASSYIDALQSCRVPQYIPFAY